MAAVQIVTPHLVVSDANAAIAFYKRRSAPPKQSGCRRRTASA
jgi:hypothetical protein